MPYTITIKSSAKRSPAKLPKDVGERMARAIDALAYQPRPSGCKKLQTEDDLWRIRVGDYRIDSQLKSKTPQFSAENEGLRVGASDRLPPVGGEHDPDFPRKSQQRDGLAPKSTPLGARDDGLERLIDAWAGLSERTKRKIIALIEADERERREVASATPG